MEPEKSRAEFATMRLELAIENLLASRAARQLEPRQGRWLWRVVRRSPKSTAVGR
jgi:hypothetical protein